MSAHGGGHRRGRHPALRLIETHGGGGGATVVLWILVVLLLAVKLW